MQNNFIFQEIKKTHNMEYKFYKVTLIITILLMLSTLCKGQLNDIDGGYYKTVIIGKQEWMAQNLNVSKFNNGVTIFHAVSNEEWQEAANNGLPAWCYYDSNPENGISYGKLYNWYAIETDMLCPVGWHVPTDDEWNKLEMFLGGSTIAGGKLKSTRTEPNAHPRWDYPNEGATNEYAFNALPGGWRSNLGSYNAIGFNGYWWSSSETNSDVALFRYLNYSARDLNKHAFNKKSGMSVLCIKD